jgi:hypothetical protein
LLDTFRQTRRSGRRFSNPALLPPLKSSDILRRVRNSTHPAVTEVLRLIDHHAADLEQEALIQETGLPAL